MFLRQSFALLAFASVATFGSGQAFQQVAAASQADLERALQELAAVERRIADERIPLSRELNQLESEVIAKRREAQRATARTGNQASDLAALQNEARLRRDDVVYMSNLLNEYIRAFDTRIQSAERPQYVETITAALRAPEDDNLSAADRFQRQIAVVQASITRMRQIIGGATFDGQALGQNDVVEQGRFALVGPLAFFSSTDGSSGLAQMRPNSEMPVVRELPPRFAASIRQITQTGSGPLPLDPTLGNALQIELSRDTFVQHVRKGGVVMIFILTLAGAALLVALFKVFEISSVKRPRPGQVQEIIDLVRAGKRDAALAKAEAISGPYGDLLTAGVKHSGEDKELLEEILYERLLATQPRLERFLAFIALTAGAAPLLGLLGTVTGMIKTFQLITVFGTGDAKNLSSGISEALITTEFGLYVAIPALLAHGLLSRLAKGTLSDMEQTSVSFVNSVPHKDSL
jgi:biopolymer transport protein ExbB